jgi:hypothetical protein
MFQLLTHKVSGCFVDNMSQVRCIAGESREEHNKNVFATQKQASGAIALEKAIFLYKYSLFFYSISIPNNKGNASSIKPL